MQGYVDQDLASTVQEEIRQDLWSDPQQMLAEL
jgi:hypothetical protein